MSEKRDIFSQLIELSKGSRKGPGNLQYFSTEKLRQGALEMKKRDF